MKSQPSPSIKNRKKTNYFYVTHFLPLLLSSFASFFFFILLYLSHSPSMKSDAKYSQYHLQNNNNNNNNKSEPSIFFISFIIYLTHIPSLSLFSFISISPLFYSILPTIHWRTLMLNFRNIIRRRMKNKEIRTFLFLSSYISYLTHIPPLIISPFISISFSLSSPILRTPHWRILMLNIRNIIRRTRSGQWRVTRRYVNKVRPGSVRSLAPAPSCGTDVSQSGASMVILK